MTGPGRVLQKSMHIPQAVLEDGALWPQQWEWCIEQARADMLQGCLEHGLSAPTDFGVEVHPQWWVIRTTDESIVRWLAREPTARLVLLGADDAAGPLPRPAGIEAFFHARAEQL